jgi:hypothetical protein
MSLTGGVTIDVDTAALDALIARAEGVEALVAKYAALIVEEARRLAPVDTGALRESIAATLDGMAAEIIAGEGLPDIRAVAMEYGNARVAAHPYLRPSVERYAAAFIEEVAAVFAER